MTEAEWLNATDPKPMLKFLRGKVSDRIREQEMPMRDSEFQINHYWHGPGQGSSYRVVHLPTGLFVESRQEKGASHLLLNRLLGQLRDRIIHTCHLRDPLGKPFCPSPPLPPAVLAWNDGTIPRIAEAIYQERKMPEGTLDTGRLAILADALLDAGCNDEELIAHCRGEGPHVRGCFAIDLILGKE
jgi:hypothetical protein